MKLGVYIYDGAEVLDFAGPFEVFSTAARLDPKTGVDVSLIGEKPGTVMARNGFPVVPHHNFGDHPALDTVLIPGGVHHGELRKGAVIDWIRKQADSVELVLAVCTGAFLLAEAELLDGRRVTTHWEDVPDLRRAYEGLTVIEDVRWVEDGNVITSAGISAGIDMSLYVVGRLFGRDLAEKTARQMDYRWVVEPDTAL